MWPLTSGTKFTAKDIPDLAGKVILITGANCGLGLQSALDLARHGPKEMWLTARSTEKGEKAIQQIKKQVPNANLKTLTLDLSSFESIKAAARTFTQASQRLDILMLNAGIMAPDPAVTAEGYELQFGTNHVGHSLLTKLLTPTLDRTAAEPGADVRVVVLTSAGVSLAPKKGIEFDTLKTDQRALGGWTCYGQSKLANALFARELARHRPSWTVTAVHPGVVESSLGRHIEERMWILRPVIKAASGLLLTRVDQGVRNQLWGAAGPKAEIVSGEMYFPVGDAKTGPRGPYTKDDGLAKRLWDWTEAELKGHDI